VITVAGQPDLSGEMPVDGAGNVVMPFIGPIRVGDLTVSQCQQLIGSRLATGYLVHPVVSVRVSEPRPIYILGDVRTPGTYPFRYGITVKSAVATAGGFALVEAPIQSLVMSDYLQAEERLRQLIFERAALLVRQVRLEAQIAGRGSFVVSAVPELPPGGDMSRIVQAEKATMDAQAAIVKAQVKLLQSQKPRLESEIDAINGQITNEKGRLEFVRAEISRSGQLLKQGIGTRTPEVQLKLDEATQASNLWRLAAEVSRLQRELGDLALKMQDAEISVEKEAIADLRTVRARLAELDVVLPSVRAQRDWKLQQAGGSADAEVFRTITITRTRHGEATAVAADEMALLQPGDVIDIKRALPRAVAPNQTSAR
jgi:polysaccharide export outer membrane protein